MSNNRQRQCSEPNSQIRAWPDMMKMSEAHRFLGVSHAKITSLVQTGVVPYERDPLDHRVKLIRKSDLEKLKHARHRP